MYGGANTAAGLDKYPFYGNFKIGMPEDNTWIPAVAVGMYSIGTKKGEVNNGVYTKTGTDANIYYGLVAKTLPVDRPALGGVLRSEQEVVGGRRLRPQRREGG